jgi:hypothetical protein
MSQSVPGLWGSGRREWELIRYTMSLSVPGLGESRERVGTDKVD